MTRSKNSDKADEVKNDNLELILKKIEVLGENVMEIKTVVNTIETKINTLSASLEEVKSTANKHSEEIRAINFSLDQLEQYGRRNNLRFLGISETEKESTDNLVMDIIVNKLKVNISLGAIERMHRLGKPDSRGKPRPIIVKFSSYRVRSAIFWKKTQLKGSGFIINEDLTAFRYALFKKAAAFYGVRNVWTIDGRFFVNQSQDGGQRKQILKTDFLHDKLWDK